MPKIQILVQPGLIVSSDGSHGAHGPDNPDTGETSPFAVELARRLAEYGVIAVARRADDLE